MLKVISKTRPSLGDSSNASGRVKKIRVLAAGGRTYRAFAEAQQLMAGDADVDLATHDQISPNDALSSDLIVVFQNRPGSVDSSTIEVVRQRNPLVGLAVVLGSWCEGELRTGDPLPYCERIFWYQFPVWWQQNLTAWKEQRPTTWQQLIPAIFTTNSHSSNHSKAEQNGFVLVDSQDADSAATILTVCEAAGVAACWAPAAKPEILSTVPTAGIYVGGQLNNKECEDIAELRRRLPTSAPLVALLDFPRIDRVGIAKRLGATTVLGKPWRSEQLLASLTGVQTSDR